MRRTDAPPLITFAACVVVAVIAFGWYLDHRQHLADHRAEAQRKAICAILANIPGQVPHEIKNARLVFARPGHPSDCQPLSRNTPTPDKSKAGSSPAAARTVLVVPSDGGGAAAFPRPSSHPSPTSTPEPHPTGTPSPSPSPTCSTVHDVIDHPIRCLHL